MSFFRTFSSTATLLVVVFMVAACSNDQKPENINLSPKPTDNSVPVARGLSAVSGNNAVTLLWPKSEEAVSYNLYWSTNKEFTADKLEKIEIAPDLSEYRHSELENGVTYYYTYTIMFDNGESQASNVIQVTPKAIHGEAPRKLKAHAGDQRITLTWEPPAGIAEFISHYHVYWNITGGVKSEDNHTTATASPAVHLSLENGIQYYYSVAAVSSDGGESPLSNEATIAPRLPPLSAPSRIKVTSANKQATLEWKAVEGATSYHIFWSLDEDVTKNSKRIANVTSPFIHENLQNNLRYNYRIVAAHEEGESPLSSQVGALPFATSSVAPASLTAEAAVESVTLTWAPVANASGYNVYWQRDDLQFVLTNVTPPESTVLSFVHNRQTGGIPLTYSVTAVVDAVESKSSVQTTVTPHLPPPSSPSSIAVDAGDGQVTLVWAADEGVTSYNLYWNTTGEFGTDDAVIHNVTLPYTHAGLENGVTYYFAVSAVNQYGEGELSTPVVVTPQISVPAAPTLKLTAAQDGIVTLDWLLVSRASTYNLYWSLQSDFTLESAQRIESVQMPFQHTGLIDGTTYYYRLTALNETGESPSSNLITATPVTVNNTLPEFTSANAVSVAENSTSVMTITSSSDSVQYTISGGTDALHFEINGDTGILSFKSAPDYESTMDSNGDNVYQVEVTITNNRDETVAQLINVSVTDINDNVPVFSSTNTFDVVENSLSIFQVVASDVDSDTLSYSIADNDAGHFQINTSTGELAFINLPDFETPLDVDANNSYIVTVTATDGELSTPQILTINVQDVFPYDSNDAVDFDGDGIEDRFDPFPLDDSRFSMPIYTISEILVPNGSPEMTDVNDSGVVIGIKSLEGTGSFNDAWVYSDETGVTFTPSSYRSENFAINNSGHIVGHYGGNNWDWRPFFWNGIDAPFQLTSEPNNTNSTFKGIAHGISDSGYVVGSVFVNRDEGFLWQEGQVMQYMSTLGGEKECLVSDVFGFTTDICADSVGVDVSNSGEVVGYSYLPNENIQKRAILYTTAGGLVDLGSLQDDNADETEAVAINNKGKIVGTSTNLASEATSGFIYSLFARHMIELEGFVGNYSLSDINDDNIIVGVSKKNGVNVATIWIQGRVVNLNEVIPQDSGWVLESAVAISNSGHIIGYGRISGKFSMFRLEPVANSMSRTGVPIADVGGPYIEEALLPIQFDGSASFDPDNEQLNYFWDFGDGSTSLEKNPMHTYENEGSYVVTLTVNDSTSNSIPVSIIVNATTPTDSDDDGTPDVLDPFPHDSSEWLDSDNDNIGDNADLDDDNDGMPDQWEQFFFLNTKDASDAELDLDGDTLTNITEYLQGSYPDETDSDFDGLLDNEDQFPVNSFPLLDNLVVNAASGQTLYGVLPVTDREGDLFKFELLEQPAQGNVEILDTSSGVFKYTANESFTGNGIFSYSVTEVYNNTAYSGSIAVNVIEPNIFNVSKISDSNDGSCDDDCSLREAVIAANSTAGPDIISLPEGVFLLDRLGVDEDGASTGDLDINDEVTIQGAGKEATVIDGNGIDRVFDIFRTTVRLSDLTVQGGHVAEGNGGGVRVEDGAVHAHNLLFKDNASSNGYGGAIAVTYVDYSNFPEPELLLDNSIVSDNCAPGGAGLFGDGNWFIANSTIRDNGLPEKCVYGTTNILNGGGIHKQYGYLRSVNSALIGNTANGDGGAIYSWSIVGSVINTTIANNHANSSGGLYNSEWSFTIINSTITGNSAEIDGGGVGVRMWGLAIGLRLQNSIVTNNTAPFNPDCAVSLSFNVNLPKSLGNNLLGSFDGCDFVVHESDITGVPFDGTVVDENTPGRMFIPLTEDSVAIDAANDELCPASDQLGTSRPVDGNNDLVTQCDIGAYEYQD